MIWPPSGWFRRDPAQIDREEKFADESFAGDKAFVREVRSFVRHRVLAPADNADLLEALARFCDLLGRGLPKR